MIYFRFISKVLHHIDFYYILRLFIKVGKATCHSAQCCFLRIVLPFLKIALTAVKSLFLLSSKRSLYIQSQEELNCFLSILVAIKYSPVGILDTYEPYSTYFPKPIKREFPHSKCKKKEHFFSSHG